MSEYTIRPYTDDDADELWSCKRGFELGLGSGTGGEDKQQKYEAKLTDNYRQEWLAWVRRCVDEDRGCVQVAVERAGDRDDSESVVGYVFVLPPSLAFIWDAAVLNEVYLDPGARGTGVADELMEAALACAREQDLPLDRLVLDVDRENDRARAFYDRWGFDHWGEMVARDL
jgi:GNAT superfamily N-acetyltransferase